MKKIIAVSFFVLFIGLVPHTFAATAAAVNTGFTALAPIPGLTDNASASLVNSAGLANFFNNLYKYLIGIAAILAVIEIIWGGLEYSTQDSVSKKSDGKTRITQAILGLVLVLSPVVVFSIINPSILNLSLNLPALDTTTTSTVGSQVPAGACTGTSCGKSLAVVYTAHVTNEGCIAAGAARCQPDLTTGVVIPRDKPKLDAFAAGCIGGGLSTSVGGVLAGSMQTSQGNCPADSGKTTDLMYGMCYNVTLTCRANTTNQLTVSKCTTSGVIGILQIANCLTDATATAWGNNCSWGRLTKNANASGGSYTMSCQGKQTYGFIDTSTFILTSAIVGLQPLASTGALPNGSNGNSALLFASICQGANLGAKTCISPATIPVTCPPNTPKLPGGTTGKCYEESLSCSGQGWGSSLLNSGKCSDNPNWKIFQN